MEIKQEGRRQALLGNGRTVVETGCRMNVASSHQKEDGQKKGEQAAAQ